MLTRITPIPVNWILVTLLFAFTIIAVYQLAHSEINTLGDCKSGPLSSGFSYGGKVEDSVFCWTAAESTVSFPAVGRNQSLQLSLRLASGRPETPQVQILVNQTPVETFDVAPEWETYTLRVPPALVAQDSNVVVTLQTPTFKPSDLTPGSQDNRRLGVSMEWAELAPVATTPGIPILPPVYYGVLWLAAGLLGCAILSRLPFARQGAGLLAAVLSVLIVLVLALIYWRTEAALEAVNVLIALAIGWFLVNQIPIWLSSRSPGGMRFFHSLGIENSRARIVVEVLVVCGIGVQFFLTRVLPLRTHSLFDFISYFATVRIWQNGGDYYDLHVLNDFIATHRLLSDGEVPFVYPPTALVFFSPLLLFDLADAKLVWLFMNMVWLIASGVFLMLALRHKSVLPISVVWFALLAVSRPSGAVIGSGQVGLFVLMLFAIGLWAWTTERYATAGAAIAIAASVKVFPVLLMLYFLYRRNWRAVIGGIVTGLVLILASLAFAGLPAWWSFFFKGLPSWPFVINDPIDQSISGFLRRLILSSDTLVGWTTPEDPGGVYLRVAVVLIAVALLCLTAWWFARYSSSTMRQRQVEYGTVVALLLLILPQVWEHYLAWLILPILVILNTLANQKFSTRAQIGLVLAVAVAWFLLEYGPVLYTRSDFPSWLRSLELIGVILIFVGSLYILRQMAGSASQAGGSSDNLPPMTADQV